MKSWQEERQHAIAITHWGTSHTKAAVKSMYDSARWQRLAETARHILANALCLSQARAWRQWQLYMDCKVVSAALKFFIYKSWMNGLDALQRNLDKRRFDDELVSSRGPAQMRWREALGAQWRETLSVMHYDAFHRRTAMTALRTMRKGVSPRNRPAKASQIRTPPKKFSSSYSGSGPKPTRGESGGRDARGRHVNKR